MNTFRVLNSLDPDQARRIVGPDLGPNCLHRISLDDTSRQSIRLLKLEKFLLLYQIVHHYLYTKCTRREKNVNIFNMQLKAFK